MKNIILREVGLCQIKFSPQEVRLNRTSAHLEKLKFLVWVEGTFGGHIDQSQSELIFLSLDLDLIFLNQDQDLDLIFLSPDLNLILVLILGPSFLSLDVD